MKRFVLIALLCLLNSVSVTADFFSDTKALAEEGYANAQFFLGTMYYYGEVAPQDPAEAAKWYRLSADQGFAGAQFALGRMYDKGESVPQDYAEAVKLYRKAADQGFADAQHNLGAMYANGRGVPQDYAEAYVWSSLAATDVHLGDEAKHNRDLYASKLSPEELSAAQKRTTQLFNEINKRKQE